jgi:hypothetical protein
MKPPRSAATDMSPIIPAPIAIVDALPMAWIPLNAINAGNEFESANPKLARM